MYNQYLLYYVVKLCCYNKRPQKKKKNQGLKTIRNFISPSHNGFKMSPACWQRSSVPKVIQGSRFLDAFLLPEGLASFAQSKPTGLMKEEEGTERLSWSLKS